MRTNKEIASLAISMVTDFTQSEVNILKKTKLKDYVYPRQLAHWLLKNHTSISLAKIGMLVGNVTHSTVLNSVKRIDEDLDSYKHIKDKIGVLSNEFKIKLKEDKEESLIEILHLYKANTIDEYEVIKRINTKYNE